MSSNSMDMIASLCDQLKNEVSAVYDKNNKAAARRARKLLQEITVNSKTFRKEIQEHINSLSAK